MRGAKSKAKAAPNKVKRRAQKNEVREPKRLKVSPSAVAASRRKPTSNIVAPFSFPKPPPSVVVPKGMAMDAQPNLVDTAAWAGGYYGWAFTEGLEFLGYPYLSQLAQRPEYRRIVEVMATEMTRKWIALHSVGDEDKSDKIKLIEDELRRLDAQAQFKKCAEQDGFFGRAHLYLDTGKTDEPDELLTPIGDGRDALSRNKIGRGDLKALRAVEAVWTYPTNYNSNNPLKRDWYNPDMWFVMGQRVHVSRLLLFIGREVPDLIKPSYSFGGLSLTQMAKPYVDNWLQARQSVNDAISAYSTFVLKTAMSEELQVGGEILNARAEIFNNLRNNRGLMMLDKDMEDFANVAAPLATLDALQAQAQEHMASVSGIPLVKLLGITPSGLNASSDGEIRCFYDWIAAYQEALFRTNLTKVINFVQLSLFGEVDPDITFDFEPLWALNEKERAEVEKIEADTAQVRIDSGVIAPEEERLVVANKPDSPYHGLDPADAPDLQAEEEEGLAPRGGGGAIRAELEADGEEEDGREAA